MSVIFMTKLSIAQNITVCKTCPISTLKKAIAHAKDFDTIVVKSGTYKEFDVNVNKPLTIIGENYPVIDGELKGEIITITSDNVTVDGLFIINVGTSYTEDYAAIRVKNSKNFLIQNLVLEKLFFGIYIEKSRDGKVFHNKIIGDAVEEYNSGNGIQLWYSNNVKIEHNFVQYFSNRQNQTTIRFDEIIWGGVLQDGIPPLRNPKMISDLFVNFLNRH